MALTVNSKIRDLMANEECLAEIDRICPGLTDHPHIGIAKNFTLSKCAALLPDRLTPEVMSQIEEMLERVTGKAENCISGSAEKRYTEPYWNFDEIIDREGTNSIKYGAGSVLNPYLPDEYIPMWVADMDFACPQPVLDAMKERIDRRILGYSMAMDPAYYAAIIEWEKSRHEADVSMDQIVFSGGVIRGMEETVRRLTNPGDCVLINTPGYHPFEDSVKLFERTPVYSQLINDGSGYYTFDWEDMERKAADPSVKLFFLCNPHNPSGRVWSEDELRRVAEIMFRNDVFIFCDEIWRDIIRRDVKHTSLLKLYPGRSGYLVATAPSKTFNLAGNQLANLIIPDKGIAAEWTLKTYCGHPNPLSIDACRAAYEHCSGWLDAMCAYLDENFALMESYLARNLPQAIFRRPEGTYLAWINMKAFGLSDAQLKEKISRAGLFIEFGDEFIRDSEGFIRINVACPRSVLKKALEILCTAMGGTSEAPEALPEKPLRLKVGDTMPDLRFDTANANDLVLSDILGEGGAVIALLRYAGCTLCQLDIRDYLANISSMTRNGRKVFVVLQSTQESVRKQLDTDNFPINIICDPDGKIHRLLKARKAANMFSLAGNLKTARRMNAAKKAGLVHGAYEGEEKQLPAVFIIDKDRKITYAHYARNISDMPSGATLGEM